VSYSTRGLVKFNFAWKSWQRLGNLGSGLILLARADEMELSRSNIFLWWLLRLETSFPAQTKFGRLWNITDRIKYSLSTSSTVKIQ
jgi:hypothetical protein